MKGTSSTETLKQQRARAIAAHPTLLRAGAERRAAWLGRAFAALSSPKGALFEAALSQIPQSAGLSREMVHWALESALSPLHGANLLELERKVPLPNARAVRAAPGQLCVVVLSGNVFTAAARAVALPLLFGMPVLAKASSHDAAFAALLSQALQEADPALAEAFQLTVFGAEAEDDTRILLEQADVVSVYGSDSTLRKVRAELPATVGFVGHGHGLGAALVDLGVLHDEALARSSAEALAFDVAAYDQRGCMSPLLAWVQSGGAVTPTRFAELVFQALGRLSNTLPRGPLPLSAAAAQLSFRGISALRGSLLEGDGFAVSYEEDHPARISPGYRNLQVLSLGDSSALFHKLAQLGVHLKCLGVAGVADVPALLSRLPARVAPRACALGSMQSPPLDALHDGVAAWEGLVRYTERDL